MAGALDQLYQQVILDHYREKHGHGVRGPAADDQDVVVEGDPQPQTRWAQSRQYNPLCGDEVTLKVAVRAAAGPAAGPVVGDVAWVGEGCSISQAATSVLHDLVVGRTPEQARGIVAEFRTMVRSRGTAEPDEDVLGDAVAFAGVGRHANRVKCAMLGWTAFEDALGRAHPQQISEERR